MSQADVRTERGGRFARVDDFDMYYEVIGSGPPLLFLNGGFGMTASVDETTDAFARHFTVYTPDARGHGRSGFGEGPITYLREATDAVGLLDRLGLKRAHVFGHSDGGCAALHLLFDFPHRVASATLCGTPYNRACYDERSAKFTREFPLMLASGEADPLGFRDRLHGLGMPLEKIRRLGAGLHRAWALTPYFTTEMMTAIDRPVLVVEAGADQYIALERFVDMTTAIPGARALRIPEMTHDHRPHAERIAEGCAAFVAALDAA